MVLSGFCIIGQISWYLFNDLRTLSEVLILLICKSCFETMPVPGAKAPKSGFLKGPKSGFFG